LGNGDVYKVQVFSKIEEYKENFKDKRLFWKEIVELKVFTHL